MKVKFIGATDSQVNFGNGEDPRKFLEIGETYECHEKEVHSWHTLFYIDGRAFNSVCFEE